MNESISVYLDLVAAKARQLAMDFRNGRLMERELGEGIGEIRKELDKATRAIRDSQNDCDY